MKWTLLTIGCLLTAAAWVSSAQACCNKGCGGTFECNWEDCQTVGPTKVKVRVAGTYDMCKGSTAYDDAGKTCELSSQKRNCASVDIMDDDCINRVDTGILERAKFKSCTESCAVWT